MRMRQFIYGQATDKGTYGEYNEDAALSLVLSGGGLVSDDAGLFIVAQDSGGKSAAEKAVHLSIQLIAGEIIEQINYGLSSLGDNQEAARLSEMLISAFQKANAVIYKRNTEGLSGGASGTALLVTNKQVHIAHVGQTKAYAISQNGIAALTIVHDLWHEYIRHGYLTRDDLMSGKVHASNKLYRGLGMSDTLDVDTATRAFKGGDKLVLCSDGVWGQVEDAQILEIVERYPDPQEACEQLIASAAENNSSDNMTVIVVQMRE